MKQLPIPPAILRKNELRAYAGLSLSTIARLQADSTSGFPMPIQLGGRAVGYHREKIDAWLASRPLARSVSK